MFNVKMGRVSRLLEHKNRLTIQNNQPHKHTEWLPNQPNTLISQTKQTNQVTSQQTRRKNNQPDNQSNNQKTN